MRLFIDANVYISYLLGVEKNTIILLMRKVLSEHIIVVNKEVIEDIC